MEEKNTTNVLNEFVEQFKENLWHEAKEQPILGGRILTKFICEGQYYYDVDNVTGLDEDWETHCIEDKIVEWCYIGDILPYKKLNT